MLYNALSYCNCIYLHFYLCNAVNIALLNAQSFLRYNVIYSLCFCSLIEVTISFYSSIIKKMYHVLIHAGHLVSHTFSIAT